MRVIAVDVDEPAERVKEYVVAHGITLPVQLDRRAKLWRRFGFRGLPRML